MPDRKPEGLDSPRERQSAKLPDIQLPITDRHLLHSDNFLRTITRSAGFLLFLSQKLVTKDF